MLGETFLLVPLLLLLGAPFYKRPRLLLEIMLAFSIMASMIGLLIEKQSLFVEKAHLLSVLSPAAVGRIKVMEHHAFSGNWPGETEPDEELSLKVFFDKSANESGPPVWIAGDVQKGGFIRQGAVHIEIQESDGTSDWWSLRPAVAGDDAPTVLWVCGSRLPPAGFHALGENLTTIPPEENFHVCR